MTLLLVTGTRRPCASRTSTANMATSSPSAAISLAVGGDHQRSRRAGGFAPRGQHQLAVLVAARLDRRPARTSRSMPGAESFFISFMPRLWPLRNSSTLSMLEWTHTAISLPSSPGQFQCGNRCSTGLRGPPRLVVEEGVLGEPADVDDAVLRADVGPGVGRGLAAVVEAGPHKPAGQPRPRIAEAPPAFRRRAPRGGVRIVGAHVALVGVGDVDAARAHGAHRLGADDGPVRMRLVVRLGLRVGVVVADHVADRQPAGADGAV